MRSLNIVNELMTHHTGDRFVVVLFSMNISHRLFAITYK
jgi:hypothetical protein